MKLPVTTTVLLSILLAGCGGGSSDSDTETTIITNDGTSTVAADGTTETTEGTGTTEDPVTPVTPVTGTGTVTLSGFKCPATTTTEANFTDTFVNGGSANIAWTGPGSASLTSVSDIAAAFSTARANDATIRERLKMPTQADWDVMTSSQKGLYLVNSERCARGLEPFEGIAPELINSSLSYATELSDGDAFSHTFGTYSTISARLEGYAGVVVGTNADFLAQAENLSFSSAASTADFPTLYEPVARAIYAYMYEDKSAAYGHRTFILIKINNENSGVAGVEGLFGLSKVEKQRTNSPSTGFFQTEVKTVMHGFDPNENWDFNNVAAAPAIYGPEGAADCLSGTYVASSDGSGNNTSICQ